MEIASAVERMVLAVDPNFEKDQSNDADKLIIHDMLIPNPFSLKTVNNFNLSPPFGLYDSFNYLMYHSTDYEKQGLESNGGLRRVSQAARLKLNSSAVFNGRNS